MSAPSLAVVLFTDLVDSTAQDTELGDEAGASTRSLTTVTPSDEKYDRTTNPGG